MLFILLFISNALASADGCDISYYADEKPGHYDIWNKNFFMPQRSTVGLPEWSLWANRIKKLESGINEIKKKSFSPLSHESMQFGFPRWPYWLKIDCGKSQDSEKYIAFSYPLLDEIEVYDEDGQNLFKIGEFSGRINRTFPYRKLVFPVKSEKSYFVKIYSSKGMDLHLEIHSKKSLLSEINKDTFFFALYFGILLALIIYNFFFLSLAKEKYLLYYGFYLICIFLHQLAVSGYASLFLWGESAWLSIKAQTIFFWLSFFFLFRLSKNLLGNSISHGLRNSITRASYFVLTLASMTFFMRHQLGVSIGLGFLIYALIFGIISFIQIRRYKDYSLYFIYIAWASFLLGITLRQMQTASILPKSFFTNYSLQIGTFIEVLALSYLLFIRYKKSLEDRIRFKAERDGQIKITNLHRSMAHDIRSPISAIDTALLSKDLNSQETKKLLHDTVSRMREMVSGLLKPFETQVVSLSEIILTTFDEIKNCGFNTCEVTLNLPKTEDIPEVCVNLHQNNFIRVVLNLVKNAFEASSNGDIVSIEVTAGDTNCYVSITDEGVGLTHEQLQQIGKMEFTSKPQGQGLGVVGAKELLLQMGAGLEFTSQGHDMGTTATIIIPKV